MQIKYKILIQFISLITLVSVSILMTTMQLAKEGRNEVSGGISSKLRELQDISISELQKVKQVADKGIIDASGLIAIDEVTGITIQNQKDFYRAVTTEINNTGDDISFTLKSQVESIDENLDELLSKSTESVSRIMLIDSHFLTMLANLAHSNIDYLKSANLEGVERYSVYKKDHEKSLESLADWFRNDIDTLFINTLLMVEQGKFGEEDIDRLLQHFEQLERSLLQRQNEVYQKILSDIDIQNKILSEEIQLVADDANWVINRELEKSSKVQEREIETVINHLLSSQQIIRSNIETSSSEVQKSIENLKKNLPLKLQQKGEYTNKIINRQISERRRDTVVAQTNVGKRIEENTQKALAVFESALAESQKVIDDSLESTMSQATKLGFMIASVCGFLGMILGFLMIRSITNPISDVVNFAGKIASGDLSERLPERKDEMGIMAKALNSMADEIEKLQQATIDSFNQTLDQVLDCVFMFDKKSLRFIYVNQGAIDHLGYEREELFMMTPLDINPEYNQKQFRELIINLKKNQKDSISFTTVHRDKKGTNIPVEVLLKYVTPTGNDPRYVAVVRDITERIEQVKEKEKMQAEILHKQKMESVGCLAAGIAHEINTPTQFIGSNIEFFADVFEDIKILMESLTAIGEKEAAFKEDLKRLLDEVDWQYLNEELPTAINQSRDGVDRVSSIVAAMKRFSHPGSKERVPVCLNEIIETALTVSRNEWKYYAEIETKLDPDLPDVPLIADEMGQVILNLVVNAAQAIHEKNSDISDEKLGKIIISTVLQGNNIILKMEDSGGGIPAEIIEKIFDPFFTTKEVGKGSGQGLAICHDVIANKHGGDISVSSTEGIGTVFTITLPLLDDK